MATKFVPQLLNFDPSGRRISFTKAVECSQRQHRFIQMDHNMDETMDETWL